MASKPKYNPDDVERWVTVRGARIPIMKDGTFGVGTMDVKTKDGKVVKTDTTINQAAKMELMAAKNPPVNLDPAAKEMLSNINYKELKKNVTSKATYNPDELGLKTTSRNAKYDTSRANKDAVLSGIGKRSRDIQNKSQERAKVIGNYANTRVTMIPDAELSKIVSRLKKAGMDAGSYERELAKRRKK